MLSIIFLATFLSNQKSEHSKAHAYSTEQREAFHILSKKCNVCHADKHPRKVFTLENMNGFARKINRQVFVWKRMPKGKEISLSNQEKETLKNWLNIELNKIKK